MDTKLCLKYRPSQLEDVVGQLHVVATLKNAAENNQFAQAYLFAGQHGSGKTSMARIVANLMTCSNVKDGKVCGQCRACKTIPKGASLDVKEMDAAANRGIDDAKGLIESATWSPQELSRKVYLIDECHQLTKEATSALLKILEEPPSYLTFILCTTETRKILPTILSRCQRFNFGKISSKLVAERLQAIAKKESIIIDEAALLMIARMSRGSLRDAIGFLEQIGIVSGGKKITAEHIQQIFGIVDRVGAMNMVKAILASNIPLLMDQVNDLVMASADAKQVLYEIAEIFRSMMILKVQADPKIMDLPDNEISELRKMAEPLKATQLLRLAHVFSDVEKKLEFNIHERWIMEATLINCIAVLRK